jgi:hypothetical protein
MGKVIYLNAWLNCPDETLRKNYAMQNKITGARNYVFYKLKEEGKTKYEVVYLFQVWIQKNKARIKLVVNEPDKETDNSNYDDLPPAG